MCVFYMNTDHRKTAATILCMQKNPCKEKQSLQLQLEPFLQSCFL